MAGSTSGCWFVLLSLTSIFVHTIRQMAWHNSFPRPHKLHTAKEAMDIVAELTSDHGGSGAAFPYAQRAWDLDPQNIGAAKFLGSWFMDSRKFSEALPYLNVAVQGAHPDSVYIVMLKQALAAPGGQAEAQDNDAGVKRR